MGRAASRLRLYLVLPAGPGGGLQDGGDGLDGVEVPGGDADDQVVGGVVGEGEASAVEAVEGDDGGERQSLVAVDEGVVAGDGVQQRGGLGVQIGVRVLAEREGPGSGQGCLEQPVVADRVVGA